MKKFYAFVAAALVSVAMFATPAVVPSDADLAAYATGTYTMCIYNEGACNDIVLIGTYCGWSGDAESLEHFQAVEGFEGWYVVTWEDATDPAAGDGVQAKPVQLTATGTFSWDYQLNDQAQLLRGSANILPGNTNEVDIKNIQPGIVVIEVPGWKADPCTAVYHIYNVTLVSPDCNDEDYVVPAISGGFNNWAQQAMEMNELKTAERQNAGLPGAVFEASFKAAEGTEYKFRSAAEWGADWTNELKAYNAEDDAWGAFNGGANFVFGEETNIEYDLGDPDLYSWNNCEKPVEEEAEVVAFAVKLPAENAPEAVEVIGTFDGWGGTALAFNPSTDYFEATFEAKPSQFFKFRGAGSWDQELELYDDLEETWKKIADNQLVFSQLWEDAAEGKSIVLDFSNPEKYRWTVKEQGIENITLTEEVKKVVYDGVLYIVRQGHMYNVQGTQVR
jgi:hypothetical protein